MASIDVVHVPYKGISGARTDILAGQVQIMLDPITTMTEQVKAGKVRAIATTGRQRSEVLPDVPTLSEAGVPGYEATIWVGLMAPKGTSPQVIQSINQEVNLVLKNPEIVANLAKQGIDAGGGSPQIMADTLSAELKRWPPVVKAAQIKAD